MEILLKTNGVYGATVGRRTVFTKEEAINRYKTALELCVVDTEFTEGGNRLLCEIEGDLVKIGIPIEEVGQIQEDFFTTINV